MPAHPPPSSPCPAHPEDHQEVVNFLERIFRPDRIGSMAEEYPHLYAPELMPMNLVSRHGGQIVSVVGAFPIAFYLQSSRPSTVLTIGGIGGVSTAPTHRGRGLMRTGLQAAFERMRDHGYAFSILWGDRQRYGHFGYEDAGTEIRGIANRRCFSPVNTAPILQWRPARPEIAADMDLLAQLDCLRSICPYRPAEKWGILLRRKGFHAFLATSESDPATHAFLVGFQCPRGLVRPRIVELGGDPELWPSMISAWLGEKNLKDADVFLQPDDAVDSGPVMERLIQIGIHANAMLKILDLERSLQAYIGILEDRALKRNWTDLPPIRLSISESPENGVTIKLADGHIQVTRKQQGSGPSEDIELALPERRMVQFLFGPIPPGEAERQLASIHPQALCWQLLLPLPFAVPELNRV